MGATVMDQVDRLRAALADRYTLDREIGRGGMAHVYRAHDRQHDRDVAIKVLRPELAAALGTERFLREIRIEARLQHPHILPLFDSGVADGFFYYVMPYVEGETLRDRIQREKQLPLADALQITKEVAEVLSYAHAHDVIHRDIKPANILLNGEHAIVADFGIAKAISELDQDSLTGSGLAVGTPEYMSPEQGTGDGTADRRSDIYALGCVLYEMLAGQPPFTGRTAQSILARHRQDPPPSLRVVRPAVPPEIEEAVETALAKVPADRFSTAAELAAALAKPTQSRPGVAVHGVKRGRRTAALATAGVLSLAVIWWTVFGRAPAGDPNKVMVYPLVERGSGLTTGAGEEVAIMIGSALEHTEPLKWIDGWTWLEPGQRADIRALSARAARATALAQRARYYIDGSVVRSSDSLTVVLRLHDNVGDSLVGQGSASASTGTLSPAQLGLRAVTQLLAALLQPGHGPDPAALNALASRAPASIANWLQGERESRRSRFGAALRYYRRAVEEDTLLALAALRGAEAAWWLERGGELDTLARLAVAHASVLPPKYAELARGLANYLDGAADSALAHVQLAVRSDSAMSVGWMMLGEVYYHLFPTTDRSLAALSEGAFETARRVDPGFTPPLYHLTELALRRGDLARAKRLVAEYQESGAESPLVDQLHLMLACVNRGPTETVWNASARKDPAGTLQAAKSLSAGGAFPDCAIAGFRAVLHADSIAPNVRWGAVSGLQSMLVARGQNAEAEAVLDSAVAAGIPAANALFIVDALAGAPLDRRADQIVRGLPRSYATMSGPQLWFLGAWAEHRGEADRLDSIVTALKTIVDRSGNRNDSVIARSMIGRLALLRADTVRAIEVFGSLRPASPSSGVTWGFWEALGGERLDLAELLDARGREAEALRVATEFDHPEPVTYLLYLPASLRLRIRAARGMGNEALAREYQSRLGRLSVRKAD